MKKFAFLTSFLLYSLLALSQSNDLQLMFKDFDQGCKIINESISYVNFDTFFDQANAKISSSKLRFAKVEGEVKKADRDSIIISFNKVEDVIRNRRQYKLVPETKMKASLTVAFEKSGMKRIAKKYNIILQDAPQSKELSKEDEELSKQMQALYKENIRKDSINKARRDSIQKEEVRKEIEENERLKKEQEARQKKIEAENRIGKLFYSGVKAKIVDVGKFEKNGEKVKGVIIEIENNCDKPLKRVSGNFNSGFSINEIVSLQIGQKERIIIPNEEWYKDYTDEKVKQNIHFNKDNYLKSQYGNSTLWITEIEFQDGEIIKRPNGR